MTDRELLERAAVAVGRAFPDYVHPNGTWTYRAPQTPNWNPFADDGDALRLAVALRMSVDPWGSGASAVVSVNGRAMVAEPHYGDDPIRATRRAIVRAAAAMAGE